MSDERPRSTPRPGPRPGLLTLAGLWLLVGVLWLLASGLAQLDDLAVAGVVAVLALPLALLLFRRRRLQRRSLLAVYLAPESPWRRRLRGGAIMALGRAVTALILALLLVTGLARAAHWPLGWLFWGLLALLVPAWLVGQAWLERRLWQVNLRYRRMVSERVLGLVAAALLLAVLVAWSLRQPVPRLDGVAMEAAVLAYTADLEVASDVLSLALTASAVLAALPQWLVQNLPEAVAGVPGRALLWGFALVREWLLVWPLLLLLQAMHGLLDGSLLRGLREDGRDITHSVGTR